MGQKKTIKLTETHLRNLVKSCVKEAVENIIDEGVFDNMKAGWNRTFNGKETKNQAFEVQKLVSKYEKLYKQYANSLPEVYQRKYQSELNILKNCADKAAQGYGKEEGTINRVVNSLNKIIGYQDESDRLARKKEAASRSSYNYFDDMEQRRKAQRGNYYDSKFDSSTGAEVDSNGRY